MIFVHSQSQEIGSGEVSLLVHNSEKCDGHNRVFAELRVFRPSGLEFLRFLPTLMDATHKRLLGTVSARFWLFCVAQEEL